MSRQRRLTRLAEDGGQSLVEFALVVPLLLVLMVGLVDLGRGLQTYVGLANALREVAREASVHGSGATEPWGPTDNDATVEARVRARAAGLVAGDIGVTSSWPGGNNARGSEVVVAGTYVFRPIASGLISAATLTFSSSTRARIQR